MFFIGDKQEIINKYKQLINLDLEIGPSNEEHQFLMEKSSYYRNAYYKKKYAFCSDVWRVYKLSKDKAIYIDFFTIINKHELILFLEKMQDKNLLFLEETANCIWNGIIINNNLNNVFSEIFQYYCDHKNCYLTGPQILTKFLILNKIISLNLKLKKNTRNTIILNSNLLDNRKNEFNALKINSKASWNDKIIDPMKLWYDKWDGKLRRKGIFYRFLLYKMTWLYQMLIKFMCK